MADEHGDQCVTDADKLTILGDYKSLVGLSLSKILSILITQQDSGNQSFVEEDQRLGDGEGLRVTNDGCIYKGLYIRLIQRERPKSVSSP